VSGELVNDPFQGPCWEMQRFADARSDLHMAWVLERDCFVLGDCLLAFSLLGRKSRVSSIVYLAKSHYFCLVGHLCCCNRDGHPNCFISYGPS
jgi:hypothetical protein